jgi:hypothetical protein
MSARDVARDLAVLKVLSERIRDAKAALERQARDQMEPGDRTAVKFGDELLGLVTLANGRRSTKVDDPGALLAWVKDAYPTEVVTSEQIRPAFLKLLLDRAKDTGEPVDPHTGEVIPGVSFTAGDPYPLIRLTADADALVAVEWQAGRLPLPSSFLPALEAPKESG